MEVILLSIEIFSGITFLSIISLGLYGYVSMKKDSYHMESE